MLIFLPTLLFLRWLRQSPGSRRTREFLRPAGCSRGAGWAARAAASRQRTEVTTGPAQTPGALQAQIYSPAVPGGDRQRAVRPDQGADPGEWARGCGAGARGSKEETYYLRWGCGAQKEAAAFPSRNGRGGGGGEGKCGERGGGRARESSQGAPGVWPQARGGEHGGGHRRGRRSGRCCLAQPWLADLCIRQAASPSLPPGPRRGTAW